MIKEIEILAIIKDNNRRKKLITYYDSMAHSRSEEVYSFERTILLWKLYNSQVH